MTMNDNVVLIKGNLTRDPEVKYTQSGTAVANFSLAVNGREYEKNGEKVRDVTFVDCEAWDSGAELLGDFKKGDKVGVEGELKQNSWEDAEGNKRSKLTIRCNHFYRVVFSKSKKASSGTGTEEAPANAGRTTGGRNTR
jgi:single-strand DNA-binding protein